MPLDAAEFISELSIVDPPGTDPLNQGDNHIRTTKKAVQQSFPNVGSAVPQTGAQMAQMAIKNEVNVFTLGNTFESNLQVNAQGRFTGNILMQQAASNNEDVDIRFQQFTPGATRWRLRSTATSYNFQIRRQDVNGVFQDSPLTISAATGQITFQDGSAAVPAFSFANETNTGMFLVSAGNLAWAIGGVEKMRLSANHLIPSSTTLQIRAGFDGTAAQPMYSFNNETGMGMYRISASVLGWGVNGVRRMSLSNANLILTDLAQIRNVNGSVTAPAYGFADTTNRGMYSSGTNRLGISTAGIQRMDIGTTRIQLLQGVEMPGLPTTNPGGTGVLWKSSGFVAIT